MSRERKGHLTFTPHSLQKLGDRCEVPLQVLHAPQVLGHRLVMRKLLKSSFLDKTHLWSVRALMGLTVAGCVAVGFQFYNYVSTVRPAKREVWRQTKEEEVALEQHEKELELLRRQREAEGTITS